MLEMFWLDDDHVHQGTLSGAIERANEIEWNLKVIEGPPYWTVFAGEKPILRADSKEAIEAFLYGMGLAYGSIMEEAYQHLRDEIKQLLE